MFTQLNTELHLLIEAHDILKKRPSERSRRRHRIPVVRPGRHKKCYTIEALSHAAHDGLVRGFETGVAA
jgi:hypothetical protein